MINGITMPININSLFIKCEMHQSVFEESLMG